MTTKPLVVFSVVLQVAGHLESRPLLTPPSEDKVMRNSRGQTRAWVWQSVKTGEGGHGGHTSVSMDLTLALQANAKSCWLLGFQRALFQQPVLRRVINSLAKLRLWSSYLEVRGTPEELEPRLSCDTNGLPPMSLVCPQRQAVTAQKSPDTK